MISQGQNTLLPESTKTRRVPRTLRYEISSYDRKFATESTNKFRWRFPNAIREVHEISIIGGSIPVPVTNIFGQSNNHASFSYNKFTLLVNATKYIITIPNGNYTSFSFASALEDQLNATSAGTFTCMVNPLNGGITIKEISGPLNFSFLFGTGDYVDQIDAITGAILTMNSPALLFGFLPAVDAVSTNGTLTSPNSIDVNMLTNRIYVYFNYDTTQDLVAFSRGTGRREPTAIIYMDSIQNDRKYLNKETYVPLLVSKPAPISRINALYISFEDFFGNPINFGGREVSLAVEIVTLEA